MDELIDLIPRRSLRHALLAGKSAGDFLSFHALRLVLNRRAPYRPVH